MTREIKLLFQYFSILNVVPSYIDVCSFGLYIFIATEYDCIGVYSFIFLFSF